MAERLIATVLPAQRVIDDGDMLLWRALPQRSRLSLGPFVFIDHYRHRSRRGIGDSPHPHAGIEVISYLLEGKSSIATAKVSTTTWARAMPNGYGPAGACSTPSSRPAAAMACNSGPACRLNRNGSNPPTLPSGATVSPNSNRARRACA